MSGLSPPVLDLDITSKSLFFYPSVAVSQTDALPPPADGVKNMTTDNCSLNTLNLPDTNPSGQAQENVPAGDFTAPDKVEPLGGRHVSQ